MKLNQIMMMIAVMFVFPENLAIAGNEPINNIEGYYSAKSNCSMYDSQGQVVSCAKNTKDCIRIKKLSQEKIKLEVYSNQVLSSSCALNSIATQGKNAIFVDLGSGDSRQKLIIYINKQALKLNVYPKASRNESCGVHASLDGLVFKRSTKQSVQRICFDD